MSAQFPPCPASLKSLQHYLKAAAEHDQRDPVISYWCRLFALQLGLKIDRKSDEAKALLTSIMDWLETQKKSLSDNEAVTNDVAAQAHIENYALKLFLYADSQDRAANFGKNVVKAFYTAGVLYDVLTTFGELTDEATQNRKYAKWKAAYIHNCLKNGETPVPGPMQENEMDENTDQPGENTSAGPAAGTSENDLGSFSGITGTSQMGFISPPASSSSSAGPSFPNVSNKVTDIPAPYTVPQPLTPTEGLPLNPTLQISKPLPTGNGSSASLNPAQITKAQKYCKWASSALNYDDVPTAIENLEKALVLLRTGADTG
ncbi:vacuolar protein sorting-associated protein VTA1 homolog isoform X1 [Schistocerca americana]|uniref:vacuolar protein sorting-associated protein VTA1 homolog isoform X1 n=2 Tax=Schistocerca americana TaxID=7009 RepID=UPI001F50003C|nr:vacuolar protein sorting-associated protein VTA1 homolog isoform X1 [Schistocerca americana]